MDTIIEDTPSSVDNTHRVHFNINVNTMSYSVDNRTMYIIIIHRERTVTILVRTNFLRIFIFLSHVLNNHTFRNNDRMELIMVPNEVEFPLVLTNAIKGDQKYFG